MADVIGVFDGCDNNIYRTHEKETSLFQRLESSPSDFSDEDLRILMATHEHSRGRNASIPAKCFFILESRHGKTA